MENNTTGNRLLQTNDSQAGLIQTSYDGNNRVLRETSPTGQIDYSYYTNGLRKTQTVLNQPAVSYSYDNGNLNLGGQIPS
jgi:YD repeat-containing protein